MFRLADNLYKIYEINSKPSDTLQLIKMVIDKILQHTTPSKFQLEIEKQIPELVAYVKAGFTLY
jgi:hypothetical protein